MVAASSSPSPSRRRLLPDVLEDNAGLAPDRLALVFDTKNGEQLRLTRAQLAGRIRVLAAALVEHAGPGERAVIACPIGQEFLVAFLACLRAGVVAVPIYPPSRRSSDLVRAAAIVTDAAPRLIVTSEPLRPIAEQLAARSVAGAMLRPTILCTTARPARRPEHAFEPPPRSGRDLAMLQYTSGSTGDPKGVMLSHDNLLHNLEAMQQRFAYTPQTHGVHWLPPYHDMGLIGCSLLPLYVGFCSRSLSPLDFVQRPLRWLRALSEGGEATSAAPTFGYARCIERIDEQDMVGLDLSRWRVAVVGAEPVRSEVLDAFAAKFAAVGFRREAFYPSYGLAESTLMVTGGEVMGSVRTHRLDAGEIGRGRALAASSRSEHRVLVGCGRPAPGDVVVVVDPARGAPCGPGKIGEIWVSSPSVTAGYWGRASGAQPFAHLPGHSQRFLRTGDLGVFIDGELLVTGRLRDLIIANGRNHHPQDIEQTIEQCCEQLAPGHGSVFQVASTDVCSVHEVRRRALHVFDIAEVAAAVRRAVMREHGLVLAHACFVRPGTVPMTSSGKIRRAECRRMFEAGAFYSAALG